MQLRFRDKMKDLGAKFQKRNDSLEIAYTLSLPDNTLSALSTNILGLMCKSSHTEKQHLLRDMLYSAMHAPPSGIY